MSVTCPSPVEQDDMLSWFSRENGEANIEGIVWHCTNGELYKVSDFSLVDGVRCTNCGKKDYEHFISIFYFFFFFIVIVVV